MKKILIVLLVVSSVSVFGIDHGLISGFEVGFNVKNVGEINDIRVSLKDEFSLKTITGIHLGILRIIGSYEKTFKSYGAPYNIPVYDIYGLTISVAVSDVVIGCVFEKTYSEDSLLDEKYYSDKTPHLFIKYYKEF